MFKTYWDRRLKFIIKISSNNLNTSLHSENLLNLKIGYQYFFKFTKF